MNEIPTPHEPLKVALIGAGNRARRHYGPVFSFLKPWGQIVAVCDPVEENCRALASMLDVPAYFDIRRLVADGLMEAALVVTPIPSHHSISVYLSSHGIHNMCETTWCSTLSQAKEMIQVARQKNVVVRVAENFFRFSIDRFAQTLNQSGYLGGIHRIFSYNDHTGYHNNSRWIAFAKNHPLWVQSIEHSMPTVSFYSTPQRYHQDENFRARYFGFPNDLLVIDSASNIKGFLGRQARPGHTEWQGERGTLVYRPEVTELRYCSEAHRHQKGHLPGKGGGRADQVFPVERELGKDGQWIRTYCQTRDGVIEYINPHRLDGAGGKGMGYNSAIADHIIDFLLAARGIQQSEFDEEDAMMSLMMDVGAKISAMNEGRRIKLPLEEETEVEAHVLNDLRQEYGVAPMDVEAMLSLSYPKP